MSISNLPVTLLTGDPTGVAISAKPTGASALVVVLMVESTAWEGAIWSASLQGQPADIKQTPADAGLATGCMAMIWNKSKLDQITFPTTLDTFDDGPVNVQLGAARHAVLWIVDQAEDAEPVLDWGSVSNDAGVPLGSVDTYTYSSGSGVQGALPVALFSNVSSNRDVTGVGGDLDTVASADTGTNWVAVGHGPALSGGGGWSGSFSIDLPTTGDAAALFLLFAPPGALTRAGSGAPNMPAVTATGAGASAASVPVVTSIGGDGRVKPGEDAAYTGTDAAGLTTATLSNANPAIVQASALSGQTESGGVISITQGSLPYTLDQSGARLRGELSANFSDGVSQPTISVDLEPADTALVVQKPNGTTVTDTQSLWWGLDPQAGNQLEVGRALSGGDGGAFVENLDADGYVVLDGITPGETYTLTARFWSVEIGEWGSPGTFTIEVAGVFTATGIAALPVITASGQGSLPGSLRGSEGAPDLPALTATGDGVLNKLDVTPPIYEDGPTLVRFGAVWADLVATTDERCTRYGLGVLRNDPAPTEIELLASASTAVMNAGEPKALQIKGLPERTELDLYELAADPSGNVTAVQGPVAVETLSQGQIIVGNRAPSGAAVDWETLVIQAGYTEEPPDYTFSGGRTSRKKSPYDGFD